MAIPSNIAGNMPEPEEVWLPCYRCEFWVQTPTDPRWGFCLPDNIKDGCGGEYTKRDEGCWVEKVFL